MGGKTDRKARLNATQYHNTADFESAMSGLTMADLVRLKRVGLRYSGGTGMSPDELLSEAYVRAAANSRKWPVGVDVIRFMAEAMRSIASGARDAIEAVARNTPLAMQKNLTADAEAMVVRGGVIIDFACPFPSPEQQLIGREEASTDAARLSKWRQELLDLFADDYEAQLIVEGMMEGLRGNELQELAGLTEAQFPTKYKKVQRRIDALTVRRTQS
jgi:hypothetical protein